MTLVRRFVCELKPQWANLFAWEDLSKGGDLTGASESSVIAGRRQKETARGRKHPKCALSYLMVIHPHRGTRERSISV